MAYGVTMARPQPNPGTASRISVLENAQLLDFYCKLENGWLGLNIIVNTKPPGDVDAIWGRNNTWTANFAPITRRMGNDAG